MAQAVEWGKRSARLNDIAPGIIVTPLALDELGGPLLLWAAQTGSMTLRIFLPHRMKQKTVNTRTDI